MHFGVENTAFFHNFALIIIIIIIIIIISCLYYSQVKLLNHATGCHAGQQ